MIFTIDSDPSTTHSLYIGQTLLNLSVGAFNEALLDYIQFNFGTGGVGIIEVQILGQPQKRVICSGYRIVTFSLEKIIKTFDQGHFYPLSVGDKLQVIREVLSYIDSD